MKGISDFSTSVMWRNLKSPLFCVQFMVFCCILHCFDGKFVFSLAIYAVLSQNQFCDFRTFVWRKILPKIVPVEKNDKYEVWTNVCGLLIFKTLSKTRLSWIFPDCPEKISGCPGTFRTVQILGTILKFPAKNSGCQHTRGVFLSMRHQRCM